MESKKPLLLIAALGCVLYVYFSKSSPKNKSEPFKNKVVTPSDVSESSSSEDVKVEEKVQAASFVEPEAVKLKREQSEKRYADSQQGVLPSSFSPQDAQGKLAQAAFVEVELPGDMEFEEIEMDDESYALYGKGKDGASLEVIGTRLSLSDDDVHAYLKSEKSLIRTIGEEGLSKVEKFKTYNSVPGSGIKNFEVYSGQRADGQKVFVAVARRDDGKGTYVFLASGSEDYFDESDDFEKMQKSLKAKSDS